MPGKWVLVVEDDPDQVRILQIFLRAAGYQVEAVGSGLAALRRVAEQPPHLVILDLRLPDLTGYDVCKRLRKLCQPWDLPILILTAMDRPADQLRGFAHGADAYLTKPYECEELLKTVTLLLGEAVPA